MMWIHVLAGECDGDGVARRKRSALLAPDHDSLLTRMSELEKRVL